MSDPGATLPRIGAISRDNHTVPKFYLDRFTRDEWLSCVKLPGDKRFDQATKNVSVDSGLVGGSRRIDARVRGPDVLL